MQNKIDDYVPQPSASQSMQTARQYINEP